MLFCMHALSYVIINCYIYNGVQRLHLACKCMGERALHLKAEVYQVTVYIRTTALSYSP